MAESKRAMKKRIKRRICRNISRYAGFYQKSLDIRLEEYHGKPTRIFHPVVFRHKPQFKACPVCGEKSRRGFFKSCDKCAWVLEYRKGLDGLLEEIEMKLHEIGAGLDRTYIRDMVNIRVFMICQCVMKEAGSNGEAKQQKMEFSAARIFPLNELRRADFTKKDFIREILSLYKCVKGTAEREIDENGNAFTLCGVVLPVMGKWKMH